MKQKRNAHFSILLAIFLGSVLACLPWAGAAAQDKGPNEKLLAALRDADAQTTRSLLSSPSGGADANARDDDGLTALMYAAMYVGADCVKLLLAQGADPNAKSKSEVTALMLAIGQADKVRLLLAKGAEVNARSKQGHTALTIAVARVAPAEVVKLLLDQKAELTDANILGAAARSGDIGVAQLLLERGADPNNGNKIGGPAPASAKRASQLNKIRETLLMSPFIGIPENIGGTPLMYAAASESNDPELIKALIAKGAEINVKAKDGETALKLAGRKGRTEIVRLLEKLGAKE